MNSQKLTTWRVSLRFAALALCGMPLAFAQSPDAAPRTAAINAAKAPGLNQSGQPGPRPLVALGPGDVINVQVFGRPELTTTTSIAEDGSIVAPLLGPVQVAGLSTAAAAQKIAGAYRDGQLLRNPQVTILISQARSQLVSVLGEVRAPGRFPVDTATTVLDVLAQAGGTTDKSGDVMYIIRNSNAGEVDRRMIDLRGLHNNRYSLKLLTLQGGDSVFVPPAEQFYIYGEVQEPNMYRLEPNMTVLQAISRGGGLTKLASRSRVEIKRRDLDSGQLITRKARLHEIVQADDVIYVKESLF